MIAITCVRSAVVARAGPDLSVASAIWPAHPDVLREEIMLELARASAARGGLRATTASHVDLLAKTDPLAAEPFAVEGALALRRADYERAEQFLLPARQLDPRNRGVRFLLADTYLSQQKVELALRELVTLAQLSPEMVPAITASLAGFARVPGALTKLQQALSSHPDLKSALLYQLADNPANAQLVVTMASPVRPADQLADWQQRLLSSLVTAGRYKSAFDLWQRFSRRSAATIGNFADAEVHSPFTWTLAEGGEGTANADGDSLDVDFFGRTDVALASRVLLLEPGTYELRFELAGATSDPSVLHWVITCLPGGRDLSNAPLVRAASGPVSIPIQVPADCQAVRFELKGFGQTYPTELSLTLSNLELHKQR